MEYYMYLNVTLFFGILRYLCRVHKAIIFCYIINTHLPSKKNFSLLGTPWHAIKPWNNQNIKDTLYTIYLFKTDRDNFKKSLKLSISSLGNELNALYKRVQHTDKY